ncbi:Amine oxidase:FAD dependent oxidoreductase [Candidatus Glomeribacter gigasporarum BEG34]|uniref:Amine oxidase:FAD dependent oxidoreductase n=2 Tax=Candidatus Glomeribacter gigasporarum TaxID=132144 RepID=G2J9X4_9BURK|nr:Amine oxidase:FAD dependent oxidoreductase [Candidatus Glomeribacter gigasporarum BEG34]
MGLAAAYQLVQEGYPPVIFEADDRIGGMTAAFDFNGLTIERYYHFHCISDHAFLQTLDELGLADKMHWVETKMGYWTQGKLQPWGNPLALLKFQGLSLPAKIRYGLHAFASTKRNDWRALDGINATRWIKRWVGQEAYDVLWRTLFDYKFYEEADHLSAAWIWSRIRRIGRSRYNLFREKLGYLEGGSETLLQAMRSFIETRGGEFRLKCPVSRVVFENRQTRGVEAQGKFHPFHKVISTVPLPYIPRLMPGLPEDILCKFKAVKNIAVVCVIAKLKRAVSGNFWVNVNDPHMDIPGLVEYTHLRPLDHHIVYVPFYMPGAHPKFQEPDQVFLDKVQRYLLTINPALNADDLIELRASRYRSAQPVCPPHYLDTLPPVELPVKGLWAADTSYYYPEDRGISESIEFGKKIATQAIA